VHFAGNTMIVVATDYATRWAETKALPTGKARPVTKFILDDILTRHGSPRYLLSDRGKTFQSEIVTELLKIMGVRSSFSTSYHPQFNGLTERFNKTLADMLSVYINTSETDWDEYLLHVTFAYNTSRQDATKMIPFSLVYAREAVLPTEATLTQTIRSEDIQTIRDRALAIRGQAEPKPSFRGHAILPRSTRRRHPKRDSHR
ncbi:hypothetical protein ILUMI_16334, partial [Ignelater luminosus]